MGAPATLDVEHVTVYRPHSTIAASFLRLPCSGFRLTINDALMDEPGAREWAKVWFRLRALTQGRAHGLLAAPDLARYAPYVIGHQHAVDV